MAEALASLDDLAAVGSINVDWSLDDAKARRARRLLEMATSTVVNYLSRFSVTRTTIAGWDEDRLNELAAVIAEIAAKRLQLAAASNVDIYDVPTAGPLTIKLNRWEKEAIRNLIPGSPATGLSTIRIDNGIGDLTGRIDSCGIGDDILTDLRNGVHG